MVFKKEDLDSDSKDSEKKKFIISARNLFLMYSQTFLTKEDAIEQLKAILMGKINQYIVCQQKHQDSDL
jgi:hypothetical protein